MARSCLPLPSVFIKEHCRLMRNIVYTVLLTIIVSMPLSGYTQDMTAYDSFVTSMKDHSSLDYDLLYYNKKLGFEDTIVTTSHVRLIKAPEDKLFGGYVYIGQDTGWVGYNGDNILAGDNKFNEILFIDPSTNPNAFIKSTMNDLIVHRFLSFSDIVEEVRKDPTIKMVIRDTVMDQVPVLSISIDVPPYDGLSNENLLLTFDKTTGFYHHNIHRYEFQGDFEYREWRFSRPVYGNTATIREMTPAVVAKYKVRNNYDTFSKKKSPITNLSVLEGKILNEKKFASLVEDSSPYILLDFWYSACHPCIKSIPVINQLKIAYGEKGVSFYGVNPIDSEETQKQKLANFLFANPMMYPTIMPNKPIDEMVTLQAYPTIIILDRYRNIVHQETGYSPQLQEKITAVLDKLLQ